MLTLEQALKGTEFWHMSATNADGSPARCRKNGAVKTWKTRPGQWKMPVKHGLRQCFYIGTVDGCDPPKSWCTPELWPAEHVLFGDAPRQVVVTRSGVTVR